MKFTTAALSTVLLAGAAVAAPLTAARQARHANRRSNLPLKANSDEVMSTTGERNVQYSSNWAGGVLVGSGYTEVSAEFVVPVPSIPPGGNSYTQYCASAWVGIDGDTCQSAILQTGVDFCVQGGSVSYSAWYEWFPNYAYDFTGISINAGDTIQITVQATSSTSGYAYITNLSNGQQVSQSFYGETAGSLCETNAEWIVEDFQMGGSLVPFADFGTVTFSNAYAIDNGVQVGPSGAQVLDIEQNGQVLTSVSIGSSDVQVRYV